MVERPKSPVPELFGRGEETAVLLHALHLAGQGHCQVVRLVGDAGVGKTSLLRWLAGRAEHFNVLRSTSLEAESQLAFAALAGVVERLQVVADVLDPPHRSTLAQALDSSGGQVSELGIGAASLALLTRAAEKQPTLLLLDDVQWMDEASAAAFLFAVSRCADDRIMVCVATRSGRASVFDDLDAEVITVGELGGDATTSFAESLGVARRVAVELHALTGGNPLAIRTVATGLGAAQRDGFAPLPDTLRLPQRLAQWLGDRLEALPGPTQQALLLTAIDDLGDVALVSAAVGPTAGLDLGAAEAAGILHIGGSLVFAHPLYRSALVSRATPSALREGHRLLARTIHARLETEAAPTVRSRQQRLTASRAWHLAAGVTGPDDLGAIAALVSLAEANLAGGANGSAARAFERAAELWSDPLETARLQLRAVEARIRVGQHLRVVAALRALDTAHLDAAAKNTYAGLYCQALIWTDTNAAIELALRRALELDTTDTDAAIELWATIGMLAALSASFGHVRAAQDRLRALAAVGHGNMAVLIPVLVALFDLESGEARSAEPILAMADHFVAALSVDDLTPQTLAVLQAVAHGQILRERWDLAEASLRAGMQRGRALGMSAYVSFCSALLGEVLWRTGRYTEAAASALVDVENSAQVSGVSAGWGHGVLASTFAVLGAFDQAEAMADVAISFGRRTGMVSIEFLGLGAIGLVQRSRGNSDAAMATFELMWTREERHGFPSPSIVWWQVDLAELFEEAGRTPDLRRLAAYATAQHERNGLRYTRYLTERLGAMNTPYEAERAEFLSAAVTTAQLLGSPYEEVRARMARARLLGQGGADVDDDLGSALAIARRIGARPLEERVRRLASADDDRATELDGESVWVAKLSKAELRVALCVGRGFTDREAAEELYLSARTVDAHLRSVFRKLGLRNRGELANLVGRSA